MKVSNNAVASVSAALGLTSNPRLYTDEEYEHSLANLAPKEHSDTREGYWFTVTTIAPSAGHGGQRTVGIFESFEKALQFVKGNPGWLWEFSYMYLCIESVLPNACYGGMGRKDRKAYWYVFKQEKEGDSDGEYLAIPTPSSDNFKYLNSFAIG